MDKGYWDGIGEPTVVQQVAGAAFRVEQPNIKRPWWKKLKPESLGKANHTLHALKRVVRKPPPATKSQQDVVVVVLKKVSLQDEVLYNSSSGGAAPVSLGAAGSSTAGYVSSGFTTGFTTSGNGPSTGSGSRSDPSSHPGSRPGSDSASPACPATAQNASLAVRTSTVPVLASDRNNGSRSPDVVREGDRESECEHIRNDSANYDLRRNSAGGACDKTSDQKLTSAVASHERRDDDQSNPRLHVDDSAEQGVTVPSTGLSESQHVQPQHTVQGVSMDELAVSSRFHDSKERAAAAISHFMHQSTIEAPDSTYTTFQADVTGNLVATSEIPVPSMTGRIGEVLPISRAVSIGVDEPLEVSKGAFVHLFAATAPVDTTHACGGAPDVAKVCKGAQAAAHAIKAAMHEESVAAGALPADVMMTKQDIMSTGAPEASDGESSPGPFHRRTPQQPTAVIRMGAEFIRLSQGGKEADMYKKPHLTPPETPTYIPPDEISAIAITPEQTQHIPCMQADPRLSGFAAEVSRAIKKTAQNACENGDSKNTICVLRTGMHATPDPSVPTTPTFAPSELLNGGECMTLMHVEEARNTQQKTTSAQVAEAVAAKTVNSGEKRMHVSHASASHLTPAMFATYSGSEDLEDSEVLSDAETEIYNAPEFASSHQASLEVQLSENPASLPHLPDIASAAVKVTISIKSAEHAGVNITANKDDTPVEPSMFFSAMPPKSGQIAEEVVTGTLDELATDSLAHACMAEQHAERVLSLEGVNSVDALAAARLIHDATQGTCACAGGEVEMYKLSIASSDDPWYSPQARSPAPPLDTEQRAMHHMQTPATSGPVSKQNPDGPDVVEGVHDAAQATAFETCADSDATPQVDSPDGGSGPITICGDVPSSHPTQNPAAPSPLSQQHTVTTSASGDNSSIMKAIDSNVQADIHRARRDTESNAVNRWSPLWYCWDKDYVKERNASAAPMCGGVGNPSVGEEGVVSRGGTMELFSSVMRACMPPRTATESSWSLASSTATAPAAVNFTEATGHDAAAPEHVHAAAAAASGVAAPAADALADIATAAAPAAGAARTGDLFSCAVPADLSDRRSTSTGAIVRATSGSGSALLCTSSEPNLSGAQTHTITSLAQPPSTPTNASSPPSMPLVPPPALPPIRTTHANPTFTPSATSACMPSPCTSQDAACRTGVYQDPQSYALPPPVFFSPATSSLKLRGQQNSLTSARTSSYLFPHALPSSINETSTICTSVAATHSQIQTRAQNETYKQGLAAEDQSPSGIMPPKHNSLNLRDSGTWREPSDGDKALPLHEITPEHACVSINSSSPATLNVESARTPSPDAWPSGQDSYMHATPQLRRPEVHTQHHVSSEQKNAGDKQIASTVVSRLSKEDRAAMVELGRLSAIHHPNLARYISCGVLSQKVEEGSGNTAPSHFIAYCQECPGGVSLRSIINDATCMAQSGQSATALLRRQIKRPYSFMEALQLSKQAVDALQKLHTTSPEVVHGGLTSDSLIVSKSKGSGINVKLKGFGLDHIQHYFSGAQLEAFTSPQTEHMQTAQRQIAGDKRASEAVEATGKDTMSSQDYKLLYKAPEVLTGAQCDAKGDMYSLGIIMYELFTMCPLATTACIGTKHTTTKAYTSKVHGGHREVLDESWPEGLRQAIGMCWHDCPDVRPSAAHLRNMLESLEPSIQQMDCRVGGAVKVLADSTVQQNKKRVKGVKLPWKQSVKAQVDAGKQCAIM